MLVALFDAASDRLHEQIEREHETAVEGARLGTIFASSGKKGQRLYERWRRSFRRDRDKSAGLTGRDLESAVMSLAAAHPEYVTVGA